jgi:hypothetical protein
MAAGPGAEVVLVAAEEGVADSVVLAEVHLEGEGRVAAGELLAAWRGGVA